MFYPLELLADLIVYKIFSFGTETHLAYALHFFIYDTIKVFLLLVVIIFLVSIIRTFLPPPKIRRMLSHKRTCVGNIIAALVGIVTPFCTCSAIPLFLGFVEAGVPLGVTFSFLVSSPMINEVALVMLLGMFGVKVALLYVISGLFIAILSGILIGRFKLEYLLTDFVKERAEGAAAVEVEMSWKSRVDYAKYHTGEILKKVWPYVVVGIGIGAWIHGYVPVGVLAKYASADKWYAVPFATLIGIPLYSNAAGIIPLVGALTEKGVSMGTALAFMMAVTALSLPEFTILKKIMTTKLILIFAGIVGTGIMFTGYLFNLILK